jgi:uncharacterized protein
MKEERKMPVFSWLTKLAGDYNEDYHYNQLSDTAKKYIVKSFKGIQEDEFRDYHCHIVGIGTGNSGNFINQKMANPSMLPSFIKFSMYSNAAGITNFKFADQQYIKRLLKLVSEMPGKFTLMAWDKFYRPDGTVDKENTLMYVPNELIYQICSEFPEKFIPCISIHPYRKDAIKELDTWAALGIKQIKWAPNSMGIDPSDKLCSTFYKKVKEYNMVIYSHTGKEEALPLKGYQHLGNPLLFRRALDLGVKVVMAHCAGLGSNIDYERKGSKNVKNYKLFIRLMNETQYQNNLFGDIAGITQLNRCGEPLKAILASPQIHERLINGSDYPLPAINSLIWTSQLNRMGYISDKDRKVLNEIYQYNPMLFDFVLKRALKHPKTGDKFSINIFKSISILEPEMAFVHI